MLQFIIDLTTGDRDRTGKAFINNLISKHDQVGYISDWEDQYSKLSMLGRLNEMIYKNTFMPFYVFDTNLS